MESIQMITDRIKYYLNDPDTIPHILCHRLEVLSNRWNAKFKHDDAVKFEYNVTINPKNQQLRYDNDIKLQSELIPYKIYYHKVNNAPQFYILINLLKDTSADKIKIILSNMNQIIDDIYQSIKMYIVNRIISTSSKDRYQVSLYSLDGNLRKYMNNSNNLFTDVWFSRITLRCYDKNVSNTDTLHLSNYYHITDKINIDEFMDTNPSKVKQINNITIVYNGILSNVVIEIYDTVDRIYRRMIFINENDILIYKNFQQIQYTYLSDITSFHNIYPIMLARLYSQGIEMQPDNLHIHKIIKQLCIKECCNNLFNDDSIYQRAFGIMPTNPNNKIYLFNKISLVVSVDMIDRINNILNDNIDKINLNKYDISIDAQLDPQIENTGSSIEFDNNVINGYFVPKYKSCVTIEDQMKHMMLKYIIIQVNINNATDNSMSLIPYKLYLHFDRDIQQYVVYKNNYNQMIECFECYKANSDVDNDSAAILKSSKTFDNNIKTLYKAIEISNRVVEFINNNVNKIGITLHDYAKDNDRQLNAMLIHLKNYTHSAFPSQIIYNNNSISMEDLISLINYYVTNSNNNDFNIICKKLA